MPILLKEMIWKSIEGEPMYHIVGNFWGRKLSWILQFCGFSLQNLGTRCPLVRQNRTIHKSFLHDNCIFYQFTKVYSLESFQLYSICRNKSNHMLHNNIWISAHVSETTTLYNSIHQSYQTHQQTLHKQWLSDHSKQFSVYNSHWNRTVCSLACTL